MLGKLQIAGLLVIIYITSPLFASAQALNKDSLSINHFSFPVCSDGTNIISENSAPVLPHYPSGTAKSPLYAYGMWIGGLSSDGGLRVAAQTYKQQGVDFWPGPIPVDPDIANPVSNWNNVWKINKSEIETHRLNYFKPNYQTPPQILHWPGNGPQGFANILAPFFDKNSNGIYEPTLGDYPKIQGDQMVYTIYNDGYKLHTLTRGNPLGIEIHQSIFGFNNPQDQDLMNTVFIKFEVINRSDYRYDDFIFGFYNDFDLGFWGDDYVGTHPNGKMVFAYNADNFDESVVDSASGYGTAPPAIGFRCLNSSMIKTMVYDNDFGPTGNPTEAEDYYGYLNGIWKDSLYLTEGGNGYGGSIPCNYHYNGDPNRPNQWSEYAEQNLPGDRRVLSSVLKSHILPGQLIIFDFAYIMAQGDNNLNSVSQLLERAERIQSYYNNHLSVGLNQDLAGSAVKIYPSPVKRNAVFRIEMEQGSYDKLSVCNISGQAVGSDIQIPAFSKSLSLSSPEAPGMYLICLTGKQGSYCAKLIVHE